MQAPRRLQLRRGNSAAVSTYVGAPGELIVNTTTNTLYLHDGVTVGGTATTIDTSSILSNIATLTANAGAQAGSLATLTSNAAVQAGNIATIFANLGATSGTLATINSNLGAVAGSLTTLTANAASQAGDLATLYANAGAQSGSIATLTSNAAVQAGDIATIFANLGAVAGSIATLTSNAAVQAGDIATLYANAAVQSGAIVTANTAMKGYVDAQIIGASGYGNSNVASYLPTYSGNIGSINLSANLGAISGTLTTLTGNAASQAGDIATIYANLGAVSGSIATLTSNAAIQAGLLDTLTGNAASQGGELASLVANAATQAGALATLTSNAASQSGTLADLIANAAVQAGLIASSTGTYSNANVASYLPTYSGNISANIVKNGNVWTFGTNGTTTLPAGGTITEGVVTSNPTIQLTPATPTVASQKLVIKGGGSYSFTTNGININYYVNTGTGGDTLIFYVYSDTYANQTLYWWIYPVGVGMTTPDSGTVVLSGSGGNFSVGIDSDAYEFTVRVSPEADNYNAGSIGVESGLINADAPPFTSEHHLHLTTGNLTETSIFLGTDDHNVRTTTAGNIQITTPNTTNKVWEFGTNGSLTFPGNLVIAGNISVFGTNGALIQPANDLPLLALSSGANGAVASLWIEDYANVGTSNIAAVYANPTPESKIVRIAVGQNGVGSGPNLWDFGNTGTTQFPGSKILAPASQSITMQSDNYSQLMWENANLTVAPNMAINSNFYVTDNNATLDIGYRDGNSTQLIKSWYWNADGNLKLPSGGYIINSDDSIYGGSGSTYANANVASYLPTYSGNIAGNIAKNGYTWTFSEAGTTTFPTGVRLSNARGANTVNFTTDIDKSFQIETQTSTTGRLWSFGTDGNLTLPQNANINFSNGVSILSTVTDLYANAAVQAGNIATIFANLGATSGSLATLTANAASQAGSLATITSVLTSTNVAIGENAAYTAQGQYAVAIGLYAGGDTQGERAVAIGSNAGKTSQGAYAVAIGRRAGETSQGNNSIIINATTGTLNQTTANTFTVAPVRNDVANISQLMFYNTTSKEITYGNTINIAGNVSTTGYFLGNGALLTGIVAGAGTTYSNANVATYLTNYDGDINFTSSVAIISNVDVITVLDHIRSPSYQYSNGVSILSGLGYGNTEVASYLPTYSGNITAGNVIATRFIGNALGTTATYTGNVTAANFVGNISITGNVTGTSSNVTLQAGAYTSVFDNQGNVRLPTAYVTGNVSAGNVFVPGTSGKIGYSSGNFAQQTTSNSTQVTSHFTSGNIQLMSINLAAHDVHTVAFACNKLTTNDMLIVKHIAGGITSVYVDAYVASDGLAVIWMRDITGAGTGAFTPMLKYAIIRAQST